MRIPKQVLIIPYRINDNKIEYCLFKRKDMEIWQWIAGGAEDFDDNIFESAKREFYEETGIKDAIVEQLEIQTPIPVVNVTKEKFKWGDNVFYSIEYGFSANVDNKKISLSDEHNEYQWLSYEEARKLLRYDSNKNALWELDVKLKRKLKDDFK